MARNVEAEFLEVDILSRFQAECCGTQPVCFFLKVLSSVSFLFHLFHCAQFGGLRRKAEQHFKLKRGCDRVHHDIFFVGNGSGVVISIGASHYSSKSERERERNKNKAHRFYENCGNSWNDFSTI